MTKRYTYMLGGAPQSLSFKPSPWALSLMRESYRDPQHWRTRAIDQARLYARWLAARDSIELPPVDSCSGFTVEWVRDRIRSVTFTRGRPVRHGSGDFIHERTIATIVLPHWDWEPSCSDVSNLREAA